MGTGVRLWSILTALLAIVAVAGLGGWRLLSGSGASAATEDAAGKNRLAVLYFEKAPGAPDSLAYLADGLTEALIRELGGVSGLQVISSDGPGNVPRQCPEAEECCYTANMWSAGL